MKAVNLNALIKYVSDKKIMNWYSVRRITLVSLCKLQIALLFIMVIYQLITTMPGRIN